MLGLLRPQAISDEAKADCLTKGEEGKKLSRTLVAARASSFFCGPVVVCAVRAR